MWLSGCIVKLCQMFGQRLPDLLIAHMMRRKKPAAKLPSLEVHHAHNRHTHRLHHIQRQQHKCGDEGWKKESRNGEQVSLLDVELKSFLSFFSFPSLKFHRLDEAHLWHDCAKSPYQLSLIHFALVVITDRSFFRLKFLRKSPSTNFLFQFLAWTFFA